MGHHQVGVSWVPLRPHGAVASGNCWRQARRTRQRRQDAHKHEGYGRNDHAGCTREASKVRHGWHANARGTSDRVVGVGRWWRDICHTHTRAELAASPCWYTTGSASIPGPDTLFTVNTMLPKKVMVLPPAQAGTVGREEGGDTRRHVSERASTNATTDPRRTLPHTATPRGADTRHAPPRTRHHSCTARTPAVNP